MPGGSERRRAPRILVAGRLGARARATLDVRILDLSRSGVRIEHYELLRPGATYTFELPPTLGPLVLTAKVVHSAVVGTEATTDGERHLRYQSGLTFVRITAEQQSALAAILERLTPGGGLGDGHLMV
jgi:hypothetical protein